MGNRTGHLKEVTIWDPGTDTLLKQDGFGYAWDFKRDLELGAGFMRWHDPTSINVYREGGGLVPSMRLLEFPDGVNSLIGNHYLDCWPTQSKTDWTFSPDSAQWGYYTGEFNELVLDHAYSNSTAPAIATSTFSLPPEPWFAVRISRGEPWSDYPVATVPAHTFVDFGQEYRVVIPYGGHIQLYIQGATGWVRLDPESAEYQKVGGLTAPEGMDNNDSFLLYVGVLRGYIMLSTDDFTSDTVFYPIPLGDEYKGQALNTRYWAAEERVEPPRVWSAPVAVGHNAADLQFSFYPLSEVTHATNANEYQTSTANFGYSHTEATAECSGILTDAWVEGRKASWTDQATFPAAEESFLIQPSIIVGSGVASQLAGITCKWAPATWNDGNLSTSIGPAVHQVQLRQIANASAAAAVTSTILNTGAAYNHALERVEVYCPEEFGPISCRLGIAERADSTLALTKPFQRFALKLGTTFSGGVSHYVTVFDGYVHSIGPSSIAGHGGTLQRHEILGFTDVKRFTDSKAHLREPQFDPLSVTEAAKWIGARCGLRSGRISIASPHDNQYLYGLTPDTQSSQLRTFEVQNNRRRWAINGGTEWLQVLKDIAFAANNSQWYYTPNNRTLHLTSGFWNLSGYQYDIREGPLAHGSSAYALYEFDIDQATVDSDDFANRVTLVGQLEDGREISARAEDAKSVFSTTYATYAGRWIDYVETRDDVKSELELFAAAESALAWRGSRADRATMTVDLIPQVTRGQLVRTSGTSSGRFAANSCNGARWLVLGYVHGWNKSDGPMGARTTLKCRWVGY